MCATITAQNLNFSSSTCSDYCSMCDSLHCFVLLYIVQWEVLMKKTLQGAHALIIIVLPDILLI